MRSPEAPSTLEDESDAVTRAAPHPGPRRLTAANRALNPFSKVELAHGQAMSASK
jgi:hypothetical protein